MSTSADDVMALRGPSEPAVKGWRVIGWHSVAWDERRVTWFLVRE